MCTRLVIVLVATQLMWIWSDAAIHATGICPESKRRYPGDCRLFYRCVLLPVPGAGATGVAAGVTGVTHAHAWLPTRCTAGLVFEPMVKRCVLPDPDWDCRNDDQLIPMMKYPTTSELPEEDITEDEHLATDKMDELNLIIPHVIEITSNADRIDEESEVITDNIDRPWPMVSSTSPSRPSPSLYQPAMTRGPYIPVTDVNGDQIATQMNRIADLAHSLKAVPQTESYNFLKRTATTPKPRPMYTVTERIAAPVTVAQMPSAGGVNVIINHPAESHYLLPIQLHRITSQVNTKHVSHPTPNESNLNFFGSNVLKHIVQQSAHRVDQQNTERVVSALFNKYLANKSFVKKNITNLYKAQVVLPVEEVVDHVRIKHGSAPAPPPTRAPCISGVRLPNTTDCRRYYICNASTAAIHTYTCPPYTAFDAVRRMCDVTQYARCVGGDDENSYNDSLELPPAEACDARDKLPDPSSARRYVLCVRAPDGRWTRHQMTCPGLLIYCPTRNFCSPKSSCY